MQETYVVVRTEPPEGRYNFCKFHTSYAEARDEAVRLSEKHGGVRFIVLKTIGYAGREANPVIYKEF